VTIRPPTRDDLPALLAIYNDAVRNLAAIWTEHEDTREERAAWLEERHAQGFPVLVAVDDSGAVMGYATYGTYRSKPGYRLTVEHSIYMAPWARGRGFGTPLMEALIARAKQDGLHVMIAVIEAENAGSIRFHERFGFVLGGMLPEVGFKHGRWLDQVHMYLRLGNAAPPRG